MARQTVRAPLQGMGNLGWDSKPSFMRLRSMAGLAIRAPLQSMGNLGRHPGSRLMRVMACYTLSLAPHSFHINLGKVTRAGNKLGMT